jgi:hypothetical protein
MEDRVVVGVIRPDWLTLSEAARAAERARRRPNSGPNVGARLASRGGTGSCNGRNPVP